MKTTKYKIQYDLDTGPLIISLTVFFNFTPGSPQTQWQPADPDEIEVVDVKCDLLSVEGRLAMVTALSESQQFYDWLLDSREKTEILS